MNQMKLREILMTAVPVTERRLALNGISTAVLEGGAGTPVVLLHGPGGYGAHWLRCIPDLVKTHRVIAPDLPGHGESAIPEQGSDVRRMTDWIEDLIECTCAMPPVLVGHTLGGALAAHFAAARGERLATLVLVDSLGLTEFQPTAEFGSALNEYLAKPSPQTHDRLWSYCLFDLPAVQRRMGNQWESIKAYNLDRILAPGRLAALGSMMESFGIPAIPQTILQKIVVPTTLIWGRNDRATRLAVAEEACERYGWDLAVIEGAADDPAFDQPEAFVEALRTIMRPSSKKRAVS